MALCIACTVRLGREFSLAEADRLIRLAHGEVANKDLLFLQYASDIGAMRPVGRGDGNDHRTVIGALLIGKHIRPLREYGRDAHMAARSILFAEPRSAIKRKFREVAYGTPRGENGLAYGIIGPICAASCAARFSLQAQAKNVAKRLLIRAGPSRSRSPSSLWPKAVRARLFCVWHRTQLCGLFEGMLLFSRTDDVLCPFGDVDHHVSPRAVVTLEGSWDLRLCGTHRGGGDERGIWS